ncbi:uncharacterized protein LOC116917802 isoform X1 [Daphnia magna]|uniref:Gustatory receptor n=2 Tax=Daphnia magna TaxID=35525 RepID=A0A0P6IN82_9CRUS|nr:uncharacterized protein LOC116917802 isoform X1 [Daphnia magna]KAK4018762.1 hypothetical protein OUZ56_000806 [Daphnia magna]
MIEMASNIDTSFCSRAPVSLGRPAAASNIPETCEIVEVSEIRDLLEYNPPQPFSTSAVLNYCQRKMILPYTRLLGLLGLRPLLGDFNDQTLALSAINKIHLFFVTCFLIFGYVMQLFTCYRRDTGFSYVKSSGIDNLIQNHHQHLTKLKETTETVCDGSLFLCYILPPLLHLCAFIQTIYLLRITDNEHLQTLFEKVFLLTSRARGAKTQRVLLRRLRIHVILSVIWLLWSLVAQIFLVCTSTIKMVSFLPQMSYVVHNSLMGIMIASTLCQDVVHCLVVSNYCIECQLLMSYVSSISERVVEKSLSLEVAMKEMLEFEKFLLYLNENVSPAIGLLLLLSTTRTIVTTLTVIHPGFLYYTIDAHSFIVIMLLIQWASVSIAPLVSAAYVTASSRNVRTMGMKIRVRPFGFQDVPAQKLDSFMTFMACHKGVAKLCFVPISAGSLGAVVAIAALIFLISANVS